MWFCGIVAKKLSVNTDVLNSCSRTVESKTISWVHSSMPAFHRKIALILSCMLQIAFLLCFLLL